MKQFKFIINKQTSDKATAKKPPEAADLRYLTRLNRGYIRYFMQQMVKFYISIGNNLNAYPCTLEITEMPALKKSYVRAVLTDGTAEYYDCDELDTTWRLYMSY